MPAPAPLFKQAQHKSPSALGTLLACLVKSYTEVQGFPTGLSAWWGEKETNILPGVCLSGAITGLGH